MTGDQPGTVAAAAEENTLAKVIVGAYINDIQELDFKTNNYAIDLYVWFRWKGGAANPSKTMEFMNRFASDDNRRDELYDEPQVMPDGSRYDIIRYQGRFSTKLDLSPRLPLHHRRAGADRRYLVGNFRRKIGSRDFAHRPGVGHGVGRIVRGGECGRRLVGSRRLSRLTALPASRPSSALAPRHGLSAGPRHDLAGRMPNTEIRPLPLMSRGPRSSASKWAET
jgi:hypothetical protein